MRKRLALLLVIISILLISHASPLRAYSLYLNGNLISSPADASVGLADNDIYILAISGPGNWSGDQISAAWSGGGVSTVAGQIQTAVKAAMTTLGINVYSTASAPVVTPTNFALTSPVSSGTTVGTVTASGSPTSFVITAGNNGDFAISNTGVLTTTAALSGRGSVSLTVTASNASGTSTGATVGISWSLTYYFSPVGSDSNNCLSITTACQTIAKLNSLTYLAGATIALDSQNGPFTLTTVGYPGSTAGIVLYGSVPGLTGNLQGAGITVTSYGGGTCSPLTGAISGCAKLQLGGTLISAIEVDEISDFTIQNLIIIGNANSLAGFLSGFGFMYYSRHPQTNVTIQNVEIQDFSMGIYFNTGFLTGGTIMNNWVHGSTPTATADVGIQVQYPQTNILVQGNLVENIGGHPATVAGYYAGGSGNDILIASGANHVLDQFNVTRFSGANTTSCGGPAGNWTYNASNVTIQFNESYGNKPSSYPTIPSGGCDWDGFDLDGGTQNSVLQYNYSHDNAGAGFLAYMNGVGSNNWQNNVIRYNISVNNSSSQNLGSFSFNGGGDAGSAVLNNTAYNHSITAGSTSSGLCSNAFGGSATRFLNNICYNDSGDLFVYSTGGTFVPADGNDYYRTGTAPPYFIQYNGVIYSTFAAYQSGTGQDAHGTTASPGFASVPSLPATTCYVNGTIPSGPGNCPVGYRLTAGSPLISTGLNITGVTLGVGTRDYYGNSVPNGVGTGYNIGADGGNQ